MQNAPSPQKAGRGGALRTLGAASLLALTPLAARPAYAEADAETFPGGRIELAGLSFPSWRAEGWETREMAGFIAASSEESWTPAAQPAQPPAPPARPVGARNSEAAPGEAAGGGDDAPGLNGGRANNLLAQPREQDLASLPFPPFELGANNPRGAGPAAFPPGPGVPDPDPGPGDPGPGDPAPFPNHIFGSSGDGIIATLTVTRRVAPSWVIEAVEDDPLSVQFVAQTTGGLPANGSTRQVSIAWADLDADGIRDGHLYRIDNGNDLAVTFQVRIVGGALLSGSATVDGNSSAFVWLPLTGSATVQFLGTDATGAAISWLRDINTQNQTDMRTTTVTRAAWAGEMLEATDGEDVFHFAPGQGVDAILGYDPRQDSILLSPGTAVQVIDIAGTAGLLVGPTNREGIVLDGIAYSSGLTLADLNVIFA